MMPDVSANGNASSLGHGGHGQGIHVFKWDFDGVAGPFYINGFIFALVLIRIAYHRIARLADVVPESCALIAMGALMGLGIRLVDPDHDHWKFLHFDQDTFFLVLLPPIILEAAYSLRDRAFWENIGTILIYAVVGTLLNISLVSACLWSLSYIGLITVQVPFLQACIFGSLICAVDPVAVLAIFEEVGVNKALYFMVFGESLLNDAVVIVVYKVMLSLQQLGPENITMHDIGLGVASFVSVSVGAIVIGLCWGVLCSVVTKYTTFIRIVEPVIIIATAYASYLCAEMVHFSGIISIIVCGIMQAKFAAENLSVKSQVMESLIFIVVGVMLVNDTRVWHAWNTSFCLASIFVIVVARFIVVFGLTGLINIFERGVRFITLREQIIIGYGGLRGAIAFSLCFMLGADEEEHVVRIEEYNLLLDTIHLFLCATYFVLLFTVFVQGITMKPLVRLLDIKLAHEEHHSQDFEFFIELNRSLVTNTMAGVEEIIGHKGGYYWQALGGWFGLHFIQPLLQNKNVYSGRDLVELDEELKFKDSKGILKHNSSKAVFNALDHQDSSEGLKMSNACALDLLESEEASEVQRTKEGKEGNGTEEETVAPEERRKFTISSMGESSAGGEEQQPAAETDRFLSPTTAAAAKPARDPSVHVRIADDRPEGSSPRPRHKHTKERQRDVDALRFALPKCNQAKAVSKRRNILDQPVSKPMGSRRYQRRATIGNVEWEPPKPRSMSVDIS